MRYLSSTSRRSLIYRQNRRGPRTEPCGTPSLIETLGDFSVNITTSCLRPARYEDNHRRADLMKRVAVRRLKKRVGEMVSNALLKSNSSSIVSSFLSMPVLTSSASFSSVVCVEWCRLKPVCRGSKILFFVK